MHNENKQKEIITIGTNEEKLNSSKKVIVKAVKKNILRKKYRPNIDFTGVRDE